MYKLLYGDDPNNIIYQFSRHCTEQAAQSAMQKAKRDPYWRLHHFKIIPPNEPNDEKEKQS